MNTKKVDVVVIGAGPVGLLCAYLGRLCGLEMLIIDKSDAPIKVGRADAFNARTLQLLEVVDLFDGLYSKGRPCNTLSAWSKGRFISRQSTWWDELEGCFHKHFMMLGQPHFERLLDKKLKDIDSSVLRNTSVCDIKVTNDGCTTTLSTLETVQSKFVIGADGSRSFVRNLFKVPFEVTYPQIIWAVLDGVVDTDFVKVPDIIIFQAETSDVAWIPREADLDRFYVQMDTKEFTIEQVVAKINRAMHPKTLRFRKVVWFSQFSVKESVAEHYAADEKVYLAGDACHIHSVNGGLGLNTGLGDAFNLIWKMNMVLRLGASRKLLSLYEQERKPVALGVVKTSAELVRSTRYSREGTHAEDYTKIIEKKSGYITGMGICYEEHEYHGKRLLDFMEYNNEEQAYTRIYSLLDYRSFTLLIFGNLKKTLDLPTFVKTIQINSSTAPYTDRLLLVRPDSYIAVSSSLTDTSPISSYLKALFSS